MHEILEMIKLFSQSKVTETTLADFLCNEYPIVDKNHIERALTKACTIDNDDSVDVETFTLNLFFHLVTVIYQWSKMEFEYFSYEREKLTQRISGLENTIQTQKTEFALLEKFIQEFFKKLRGKKRRNGFSIAGY